MRRANPVRFDLGHTAIKLRVELIMVGLQVVFVHPDLGELGGLFPGYEVAKFRPTIAPEHVEGAFVPVTSTEELIAELHRSADCLAARNAGQGVRP